jgi:hypothetical protein
MHGLNLASERAGRCRNRSPPPVFRRLRINAPAFRLQAHPVGTGASIGPFTHPRSTSVSGRTRWGHSSRPSLRLPWRALPGPVRPRTPSLAGFRLMGEITVRDPLPGSCTSVRLLPRALAPLRGITPSGSTSPARFTNRKFLNPRFLRTGYSC